VSHHTDEALNRIDLARAALNRALREASAALSHYEREEHARCARDETAIDPVGSAIKRLPADIRKLLGIGRYGEAK
jgi:hypothetical protein